MNVGGMTTRHSIGVVDDDCPLVPVPDAHEYSGGRVTVGAVVGASVDRCLDGEAVGDPVRCGVGDTERAVVGALVEVLLLLGS